MIYFWIIATLGFILWRVLTNPVTHIHQAVINNDIETVKNCLNKGVDVDVRKNQGVTPLCIATYYGNKAIAELLLDYGADLNQGLNEEDGVNPLLNAGIHGHVAIFNNNQNMVELLLAKGADINAQNSRVESPLNKSVRKEQLEIAEVLLKNGAQVNTRWGVSNATPLHYAVEIGNLVIAELLIHYGADVNSKDSSGTTLLSKARGNQEMRDLLLANGAKDYGWGD